MASLSTLRNKGGIIVAIVIGFALVAFVLGDLLSSGSTLMNGSQMTVGTVDGEKVSAMEYGQLVDEWTTIQQVTTGQSGASDEMNNAIRDQAWNQVIIDKAFRPAAAKAGLLVSEDEIVTLLSGDIEHLSPVIAQFQPFLDQNTGMFSPEALRQFIMQADQDESGQMRTLWNYLQSEAVNQNLQSKFGYLMYKSAYVTSFEAKQMAALTGNTYGVRFVVDRYDGMADSLVTVTDADVKQYYQAHRDMYRQDDSRGIEYVTFEALPSPADYAAAEEAVHKMAEELAEAANVQQFVGFSSHSPFNPRYYKAEEITGELGQFAFAGTGVPGGEDTRVYGPVLAGDQWTLARVADVQMIPDSIRLSSIVLEAAQQNKVDSLVKALRGGADFRQAALFHSMDQQGALTGGDVGMMDPQTLQPQFAQAVMGARTGDVLTVNDGRGIVFILKVTDLKGLSRRTQLGVITYNVEPSEVTRNEAFTKANRFATAAVTQGFDQATAEDALAKRVANVGPNDRTVGGIQQSRELARWAFNGKRGDISNVMEFGNNFVVAQLTAIREKGIASLDEVKDNVRQRVINEKKGELMSEKLWGLQTLDGKEEEDIIVANDVNFTGFMAPEAGYDPAFVGGLAGMKQEQAVSRPVIGRIGVYAIQVTNKEVNPIDPAIERARLQAEVEQTAFGSAYGAMVELSDVRDARYRFY